MATKKAQSFFSEFRIPMGCCGSKTEKINSTVAPRLRPKNIPAILLDNVKEVKEIRETLKSETEESEKCDHLFLNLISELKEQVEKQAQEIELLKAYVKVHDIKLTFPNEPVKIYRTVIIRSFGTKDFR